MRFILVILLFCTATAFAGTDMTIRDSISAQTSVSPDKMSSSISLTYHSKSFAETTKQMERAASIIKSYSDICDFKSYSVSPEYQYNDRTKVLVGYQGHISTPCTFDKTTQFDPILNAFNALADKDKSVQLSLRPIYWIIQDETRSSAVSKLKLDVISNSNDMANKYSKASGLKCSVASIDFSGSHAPVYHDYQLAGRSVAKSLEVSAPNKSDFDISVNASFSVICK